MKQSWVAVVTAAAMAWTAGQALAKDTIVIGYIDDLSRLVAEAGNDSLNAVKLAVAEANAVPSRMMTRSPSLAATSLARLPA
jgi:hypothetical protein